MHPEPRRADAGMTLIEVIVTTALLSLVSVVVAGAITVVFRSEAGVTNTVAQAHDVQQAVNYFHLDVQSGPALASRYRATGSADRGSGCDAAGSDNVFRFDEGERRIAYRLSTTGDVGTLDRYECERNGATYDQVSVVNIADQLDASAGTPVTVSLVTRTNADSDVVVDRVTMEFAQTIDRREVSAAPNAELGLAAGPPAATCDDDPLAAALGFGAFVEGDVYLDSGSLEGSLAVGGTLGWRGDREIAEHDTNNTNGFSSVALYADDVDWTYGGSSADVLRIQSGANKSVLLGTGWNLVGSNPQHLYEPAATAGQHIRIPRNAPVASISSLPASTRIDFGVQADELKACSDLMAGLPNSCSTCAEHVVPLDEDGNAPFVAPGDLVVEFRNNRTQVLNVTESKLATDVLSVERDNGSSLNNVRVLVVNVDDDDGDGDVMFDFASPEWEDVGDSKFVLYNFPNATGTVTVAQDAYGVVFAPYATVVTMGQVHAAVVAANWTHRGGVVENDESKIFNGTIGWD